MGLAFGACVGFGGLFVCLLVCYEVACWWVYVVCYFDMVFCFMVGGLVGGFVGFLLSVWVGLSVAVFAVMQLVCCVTFGWRLWLFGFCCFCWWCFGFDC